MMHAECSGAEQAERTGPFLAGILRLEVEGPFLDSDPIVVQPGKAVNPGRAANNVAAAQADHLRSMRTRYPSLDLELATEYGDDVGGIQGETDETRLMLNLTFNLYRGGRDEAEQRKKVSGVFEQKEFPVEGKEVWEKLEQLHIFKNEIFFGSITQKTMELYL